MELFWGPVLDEGNCILTGGDENCTWLLQWWHTNLRRFNQQPIVFADFGMNKEHQQWCKDRGRLITVEGTVSKNWFKKPIAFLRCPYRKMLWMDLDCEIQGSLNPIFAYADTGVAGVLDPFGENVNSINTGVMGVTHGDPLIIKWAKGCLDQHASIYGDQDVLGRILKDTKAGIVEIPDTYNHLRLNGPNDKYNVVSHWTGSRGKQTIRDKISALAGGQPYRTPVQPRVKIVLPQSGPSICLVSPKSLKQHKTPARSVSPI